MWRTRSAACWWPHVSIGVAHGASEMRLDLKFVPVKQAFGKCCHTSCDGSSCARDICGQHTAAVAHGPEDRVMQA